MMLALCMTFQDVNLIQNSKFKIAKGYLYK
jgi:hypothetical protein